MDLDTKKINRKIKEVKEIDTYTESAIATIDSTIKEVYELIEQLEKLKLIQRKNIKTI